MVREACDVVVRWRYALVALVFAVCALVGNQANGDLGFFTLALHVLAQPGRAGGLHLYAVHPDIQIGPLAIVAVGVLRTLFLGHTAIAVGVAAVALLLLTLRSVERLALQEGVVDEGARTCVLVGGSALAAVYAVVVPGSGHVDDLAAMGALVAALAAARAGGGLATGLWLAVAVGCKPWGLFAAAMILLLPGRARRSALAAVMLGGLVCWAPFLLAAPSALGALAHFSIPATFGSLPLQLGYGRAPSWVRPAQFAVATALIGACVRYRRPDLVLLAVAVARLTLDAGAFPYYDAELVLGCLIADVYAAQRGPGFACAPTALLAWAAMSLIHDEVTTTTGTLVDRILLYAAVSAFAIWRTCRPRRGVPDTHVAHESVTDATPPVLAGAD